MKEIYNVCDDCGIEANRLTCLKKYGQEPKQAKFSISTYHKGSCDICGKEKMCTESRDFFYPDFSLLPKGFFNENKVEHCDTPDCPECNMKAYNRGRKELLEEITKYLKDYCGATDPTCHSADYFEGFNEAINIISKMKK